ncbi:efflux RND transporter permease subunit [Flavihumibacter petaseus]|uniref:Putative RND-type efflux pump membrane/membrane fusion protein n=1 Tax=Flavihumibacter petaseus NBRC 106054 TaxID=1220578 RepID=A0A0E9N4G6_9BACT|nr:efflux RND transporter permease subunit [Flavihumibacter petaseus]GAO44683.1 putative RND-type efflux pump membrane/membrane fusion protein [Flavihumibacter petaseus NBRC 106054]
MNLLSAALKRPITVVVLVGSLLFFSLLALRKIPIDIFPSLNLPTIYVIESYGGMSPQQMEGFFATRMQDQFLYVNGVKNIESKSIQGLTLLKLSFYENTDMAEAAAQVALQVNRAMKFFPPGALPPQVIRFDASSLPVGQLVFASDTKSLKEIYDLAATRVRPMFAAVPGLSAPPPFGANSRTITINVDPDKMRSYNISPDEIVEKISKANVMSPSGNLRSGNTMYVTTINTLEKTVEEFARIPLRTQDGSAVFISDIAKVSDASDITVDYALINGKRSVYIPVVKTADASTWDVVQQLKATLPEMQSLLPDDVQVSYAFDQSVFVINAVKSLITEGALGALLTGLMVLLFLRDWRSSVVVIITIPVSIICTVLLLHLAGQTINIMTLSGLALAVGILVDQATVTIENIHQHLEMGKPMRSAVFDACQEISFPLLLILLCILAVFAPAFLMNGVPRAMFLPLSLSIGFAMIISFFLAQTLVPILSNWLLQESRFRLHAGETPEHASETFDRDELAQVKAAAHQERHSAHESGFFGRFKSHFTGLLGRMMQQHKLVVLLYGALVVSLVALGMEWIGQDLMPRTNSGQFQVRIKEPDGTRLEKTETTLKQILAIIDTTVSHHVELSSAYVGLIPSSYGTSNLYVFNSGTHEAVLQVLLDDHYKVNADELKDALRKNISAKLPGTRISFEPVDLTDKIMSQGAATPIEVRVAGKDFDQVRNYADSLVDKLKRIGYLRDVQIQQPLAFPTIQVSVDRLKAAQFGLSVQEIGRSVTASTSSSRFTEKIQWLDEKSAYTYQVQVQVPEYRMDDLNAMKEIPLIRGKNRPVLADVADFRIVTAPGEYDRSGPRRFLTISANIHQQDLGTASRAVQDAIGSFGKPPKGITIAQKGMSNLLTETLDSLQTGLLFAVVVIFLLLAANYQSFRLAFAVLVTVPAVVLGALALLLLTGSTLNLQSYMGMIMSIGVSVANAILIVTNAENLRLEYRDAKKAAITAAGIRLRPILMTSLAMIAGMIPMASGMGEAGEQTAPLGRAVIGGLIASTFAALYILPLAFAWIQQKASYKTPSLLPKLSHMTSRLVNQLPVIILAVTGALLITGCTGKNKPVDMTATAATAPAAAEKTAALSKVVQHPASTTLQLPGELKPFAYVDLYPKVNGFVKDVRVDRGSLVKKGQVLVILDAKEINQQAITGKAEAAKAREIWLNSKDRYERLLQAANTPGAVSPFELQSARSKMESDSAGFAAQQSSLAALNVSEDYLVVRAPFDGVITQRNIHPGALVGPAAKNAGEPMLVLQQEQQLRLVVHVPEAVAAMVKADGMVTFTVTSMPGKEFHCSLSRRSGAIANTMRSEAIEMDVTSEGGVLKPGMFAEVNMPLLSSSESFVLPATAVVHATTGNYVVAVDESNNRKFIPVLEGINFRDSTEVFGALKEIKQVLTKPTPETTETATN